MVDKGGRPVGARSKPKRQLLALLNEKYPGWHPVIQMADTANDNDADDQIRFNAAKEVAKYVTPQLKAIEVTGEDGNAIMVAYNLDMFPK